MTRSRTPVVSRIRLLPLIALPLAIAACGGSSSTPTPAGATADPSTPAGPTTLEVVLVEYAFQPADLTARAGAVTFVLRNEGAEEHEFEILSGDSVVDEAEGLIPGLERDLTVTLEPGSYTIVCRLADHEARGMVGTLTVTEA